MINRVILPLSILYYLIRSIPIFFSMTRGGEMMISFMHYIFLIDTVMLIMTMSTCIRLFWTKKRIVYQSIVIGQSIIIGILCLSSYHQINQAYGGTWGFGQTQPLHTDQSLAKILYANILKSNKQYEELRSLIQTNNPSIIFFAERQDHHRQNLKDSLASYPYTTKYSYGSVIFSRIPFEEKPSNKTESGWTYANTTFSLAGEKYTVLFAHTTSPVSPQNYHARNQQLVVLGDAMSDQTGSTIVLGDLNVTPYSPRYQNTIASQTGYDNHIFRQKFPLTRSLANSDWLPSTHIDHILTTRDVKLGSLTIIPLQGSDHHAIMVDIYSSNLSSSQ